MPFGFIPDLAFGFVGIPNDGSAARSAGKCQHLGETGQQAPLRRHVELELHFIERSSEVSRSYGLNGCAAFVADDVREVRALERQEESAALCIAKIRVRKNMFRRLHLQPV
jgi:hypothetical protein